MYLEKKYNIYQILLDIKKMNIQEQFNKIKLIKKKLYKKIYIYRRYKKMYINKN